uniref:acyl-CoA dehydrogenase C-terminal domain-containing protein n=1 Tax=Parendozoicomonas sp. Alg238-R29 TaxID=2993446 RepID=UPI00248DDBA6
VGERNGVSCGSLEKKMGIKASATCVMNFDAAKGFLIGPENKGLECMFTFMNTARIGTAMQGLAAAELSYQGALTYARERLSMRSLSGTKCPDKVADPLIVHPDVRRMLLTQKAFAEGGRAMLYDAAKIADRMLAADTADERDRIDDELGMLTPILKGFLTEAGLEAANNGVQVFGGHGYIREHGMEQIVRDTRIATLYEGTTGIQSLDLLGRKVLLSKGKALNTLAKTIYKDCKDILVNNPSTRMRLLPFTAKIMALTAQWQFMTYRIAFRAAKDRDAVGAASMDYLMFSGYVMMGFYWLKMVAAAHKKLEEGVSDPDFYKAKIQTAEFYFNRILPRTKTHAKGMSACPKGLTALQEEHFAF